MTPFEEYKLIIEARNFHYSKFHIWSTYFSVIVGALFVAFYRVADDNTEFALLIATLGFIVSLCWYLSNKGYTYWWIHWAKYLMHVEKKENLKTNANKQDGIESNFSGTAGVYTTFFNGEKDSNGTLQGKSTDYFCVKKGANISTSKVILIMTFLVSVAWGFVLLGFLPEEAGLKYNYGLRLIGSFGGTWVLSALFGAFIPSDISNHKMGGEKIIENTKMIKSDIKKYIICDYGDAGIGKSSTLRDVISFLELSRNAVRDGEIEWLYDGATKKATDWYAKYIIGGVKVTVCTQGDPDSVQPDKLIESVTWGADVIVCAARDDCGAARNEIVGKKRVLDFVDKTNKKVEDAVNDIEDNISTVDNIYKCGGKDSDDYIIIWHRNFFVSNGDENYRTLDSNAIKEMCRVSAKSIIELIETLKSVTIL